MPLYLHPNIPPAAVRESYYAGLPGTSGFLLSGPGFGWHAETAVHVLRLVLSGTLDRFPGLRVVVPSTPYDAKGLLHHALRCSDPVLFLEHREVLTHKGNVPQEPYEIPFGQAAIVREGDMVGVTVPSL